MDPEAVRNLLFWRYLRIDPRSLTPSTPSSARPIEVSVVLRSISARFLVALSLLAPSAGLHAQRFSFQRYGETQGLTNLVITDLLQDRQGYIWAATFNGLFRYDGTSFQRFGEKEGIATSGSIYLLQTPAGDLWAVTEHALFHLEGKRFHQFDLPIHLSLPQAVVWVDASSQFRLATDKGLATVSFRDGKLGPPIFDASTEKAPISAVYAAPSGSFWYGVRSGVCRDSAGKISCFTAPQGVPPDRWTAIRMDRSGDLWVRSEKRLIVLRRGQAHFVDGGNALPPADGSGVLSLDREGNLFVPTQRGLARMLNGHWKLVTMREGLTSGSTQVALEDQEGSLWIGHLGAGLERWRGYDSWEGWTDLEGLENSSILAIKPAANGDLFLGTDRGLVRFRPGQGTVRTWLEADGLAGDHVYALAFDREGNLWIGSSPGGLSALDMRTGRVKRMFPVRGQPDTSISCLAIDSDGSILAGSDHGLFRFPDSLMSGSILKASVEIPSTGTTGLAVDRNGRVWAAGGGKLQLRVDGKWIVIGPAQGVTGDILFVAQSEDGSVLALNAAAQAFRLEQQQGNWIASRLAPLPAPGRLVPYFIGSDSRKAIWVGTDRGVFVMEPGRSGWRWHDEDDGLVWNDTNIGAFQKGQGNDVWIGTSRGLAHYMPANPGRSNAPLRTLISAVQVNGQTLDPTGELTWRYPVTSVQIRMTALSFLNESRTRFLYRRRGIDATWLSTDSHVIMYSDLKPGTYTFEVLAESTDGVIGIEPASITLTVLPPWYLTRAFLVSAAAGLLLLIFAGYRWRLRSFVRRQKQLESAVALRTGELEAERILERNQHRVLEMIASGSSLKLVFEGIANLVRSRNENGECSIQPGANPVGNPAPGFVRRFIHASSSEPVGWIDFPHAPGGSDDRDFERTVAIALRLASVAIERASAQEKLSYQAHHDSLTGLFNRLHFHGCLQMAIAEAGKTGDCFALLYIDLDRFKQINDRYGHRIGDLYLKEVSSRFRLCIRKGDLLARIGGDEFAVILSGANAAVAERIAKALHASLANRLVIERFEFRPSASVGFSLYPDSGADPETMLRAADEAMYAAKLAGKSVPVNDKRESVRA
jgi:diguanylate cyclase (GGDEF)-like protein